MIHISPPKRCSTKLLVFANLLLLFRVNATALRDGHHISAITELKQLVPPPTRHELGGEEADNEAYARFLSINKWDAKKTEPTIRESFKWRRRVKPGTIRPRDCPILCGQHAWIALTTGPGSKMIYDNNNNKNKQQQLPLDPPYNCPPLQSWRTTKHGLPITYFRCWMWRPDEASNEESEKHLAYHIHHLIRRMPRNVSRICVVFDMKGFEGWMLPYIHRCINILRMHYPGRAGAMCFINCPGYFNTVWTVISPWLDDEIRSKTFFTPKKIDDIEKAIKYLNKMNLKTGLM